MGQPARTQAPYGLPVAPSDRTGLYDLPDEQVSVILDYAAALWIAKQAGVAGDSVGKPQVFFDKVVSERVAAARKGGTAWSGMRQAMQRDMDGWRVRTDDRAVRALRLQPGPSSRERSGAVMTVVHEAAALDAGQLERLASVFDAAVDRDIALAREALPGVSQPFHGSLRLRVLRLFDEHPDAGKVRKVIGDLPDGAWHAAVGAFLGDGIEVPYRAILCGAWDEVVHGDPTPLYHAWTDEARLLREDFLDLPPEAHVVIDPDDF